MSQHLAGAEKATAPNSVIVVVDDDESLRHGLSSLFRSVGFDVQLFGSAPDFLRGELPENSCCLVLDIRLPGLSGLELQAKLAENNVDLPIVFMTAHGDIAMSVRALKAGAVDFLTKPFRDQDMLDAVARAVEQNRMRREANNAIAQIRGRYESLTRREREIMEHVTQGLMNKQIAAEVGLSEITVKIHRGQVMKKMLADSLPDLVRMADALKSHAQKSSKS